VIMQKNVERIVRISSTFSVHFLHRYKD
jgi:hypothetical protein